MAQTSPSPRPAGKLSFASDVARRANHWLLLGRAFLVAAETCVPTSARVEPYIRRVLAFGLHQACEAFFNAILALVSKEERRRIKDTRASAALEAEQAAEAAATRSHDLGQLHYFAGVVCPEVLVALPLVSHEDARLFELLSSAYTQARYSERRFNASVPDVEALFERVRELGNVATTALAIGVSTSRKG